ncbi:hypothetical protein U9M48_002602 [Paspalum notatum var. saurae]|uniref:Uncharacterized protein n=1 Tax=Paspalum notatum var. saurae TaxID=547442 RepID=A0AAQ3PR05_PASNO
MQPNRRRQAPSPWNDAAAGPARRRQALAPPATSPGPRVVLPGCSALRNLLPSSFRQILLPPLRNGKTYQVKIVLRCCNLDE